MYRPKVSTLLALFAGAALASGHAQPAHASTTATTALTALTAKVRQGVQQGGRRRCDHPCTPQPGPGWVFYDYYFTKANCQSIGQRGVTNRVWRSFECDSPDWTTDYDLWYLPN